MKKFLIKILFFLLIFFLMEKVFYVFLIISPGLEKDKRLEKIINGEMNKEIIVLGSSRGARNILAGQIENSLKMSAYNLSYPGSDIKFHEFLLQTLLKFNKKPKIVILAVDELAELLPSESIRFRFDRLYPLSKYNYINNELIMRGEKSFLSKFLILSRINKRNFDLRRKHFSKLDTLTEFGSMPISFQKKGAEFIYDTVVKEYPIKDVVQEKIEAFLKFQKLCILYDIKLYLVISPNYKTNNYLFEKRLRQLSEPEVLFCVYDTLNNTYRNKSFFYDDSHLQLNGAVIFTNEIIRKLKNDSVRAHSNISNSLNN